MIGSLGEKGVRDEALSADGRFLYALDADARRVFAFAVREDGRLDPIADVDGCRRASRDSRPSDPFR